MANAAPPPPQLQPSGERCEVPVVPLGTLKKEAENHRTGPNNVAEADKETEHQYVFSDRKLDDSATEVDKVTSKDSPSITAVPKPAQS